MARAAGRKPWQLHGMQTIYEQDPRQHKIALEEIPEGGVTDFWQKMYELAEKENEVLRNLMPVKVNLQNQRHYLEKVEERLFEHRQSCGSMSRALSRSHAGFQKEQALITDRQRLVVMIQGLEQQHNAYEQDLHIYQTEREELKTRQDLLHNEYKFERKRADLERERVEIARSLEKLRAELSALDFNAALNRRTNMAIKKGQSQKELLIEAIKSLAAKHDNCGAEINSIETQSLLLKERARV